MGLLTGVVSAVFWGLLFLSLLVFVHEGGHYVAARAFGVRVTEFYLGLPCRIKLFHKSRRHGTEVGVTPFLLGGYNRICGMEGEYDELLPDAFAVVQREGRVRVNDLAAELDIDEERALGLLVYLSDSACIRPYFDSELGEHPAQKNYPAAFETLARDANMLTEYDDAHDFSLPGSTADAEPRPLDDPLRALKAEQSHTYRGVSVPKRLVMLVAGPAVNIVLSFVLVTAFYMSSEYYDYQNVNVVGDVTAGSLADAAGLKSGDILVSIAGKQTDDWLTVSEALAEAREAGEDFTIVYRRDGAQNETVVDMPEGETVDLIGVSASYEIYRPTFTESARAALSYGKMVLTTVLRLIMPQHTMEVLDQSSSIVGISVMASEAASSGILDVLSLIAALSMSLGFMNLLPIPPLDGGKILIELVQVLIRRPLSVKAQTAISYVGLAFFVFVFVVVLRNDVLRILS